MKATLRRLCRKAKILCAATTVLLSMTIAASAACSDLTKLDGKIPQGYDIEVIDSETSKLTLTTVYENKSHLKLYGKIWASFVFHDFHNSLLGLMKKRAER